MKKHATVIIPLIAALVLSFSTALFVAGSYNLTIGFYYHLTSSQGKFINILCIIAGSLLGLGEIFIFFFVYLPRQRKKRQKDLSDALEKARNRK